MSTISPQRGELSARLEAIWAKTGPDNAHLPLTHHMIDVAMVAGALWDFVLTDRAQARLADGFGLNLVAMRRWLLWLAAMHDLGKCAPVFQWKAKQRHDALRAVGLAATVSGPGTLPHGTISTRLLIDRLEATGADRRVATAIAVAVGGHHGAFPSPATTRAARDRAERGDEDWDEVRAELFAAVEAVVPLPDATPSCADSGALLTLASLVTVADWIGSDASRFPLIPNGQAVPSVADRYERSAAAAHRALLDMAWVDRGLPVRPVAPDLERVVGRRPRQGQRTLADLFANVVAPCLVLCEMETGAGKTEAALYVAARELANGASGAYVALPTQATANQMHQRVGAALGRLFGVPPRSVGLLHANAALAVDEEVLEGGAPAVEPYDVHDDEPPTAASSWFAQRKRGLLAPFAVGTVDQALMGVLDVRHFFVRIGGLADKVVVLDEVHAYDAYTSRLLARLVEWCAACGATVVLLSATLAPGQRRELLRAYATGAGWPEPETPPPYPAYPRVTMLDANGEHARTVESVRRPDRREVALGWSDAALDAERLAADLLEATAEGGCVAVVCNTVRLAQERFAALRRLAPEDVTIELFHARMRYCERSAIERRLTDLFGPPGAGFARPRRAIVVATQVIEQSLDVDFDALWSDLAPIDLLVQRAGRVLRHVRPKLDGRGLRRRRALTVLVRDGDDPTSLLDRPHRVYADAILLRTRAVLDERTAIVEPDDLDTLVAGVYDQAIPVTEHAALAEAISRADARWHEEERKRHADAGIAAIASVSRTRSAALGPLRTDTRPDREGMRFGTRYDEQPSVVAIVLQDGELAHLLERPPDLVAARELLRRAVRLPVSQRVWERLSEEGGIGRPEWQKSPLLRDCVLVQLDQDGRGELGGRSLRWDPTFGVRFTTEEEV